MSSTVRLRSGIIGMVLAWIVAVAGAGSAAAEPIYRLIPGRADWQAGTDATKIEPVDGALRVTSDVSQFHYQVLAPEVAVDPGRPYDVVFDIEVTAGGGTIGVLDGASNAWVGQWPLTSGRNVSEHRFVPTSGVIRLVLANNNQTQEVSRFIVRRLSLLDTASGLPSREGTDSATAAERGRCAVAKEWERWTTERRGDPVCELVLDGISLSGEEPGSGLFLRRAFSTGVDVELRIAGAQRVGQVNLRIAINGQTPVYLDAPEGVDVQRLNAVEHLELLFYADEAFRYTLLDVSVFPMVGPLQTSGAAGSSPLVAITGKGSPDASRSLASYNRVFSAVTKTYGDGVVGDYAGSTALVSSRGRGGVSITKRLSGVTDVAFSGKALEGEATLRIHAAGGAYPRYVQLADGINRYRIEADGDVEFLIYSDEPFAYRVENVRIAACEQCPSSLDLKRRISRDLPDIDQLLISDRLAAARKLLDWAANHGDWTEDLALEQKTYAAIVASSPAYTFFDLFEMDAGAVFCGGLAVFYDKLLELYGFISFVVDFGDRRGKYTHLTTVIALPRAAGDFAFYMFDPWMNMTFLDARTKEYLDLFDIVDSVRRGEDTRIRVDARSVQERDWHFPEAQLAAEPNRCDHVKTKNEYGAICKVQGYSLVNFLESVRPGWTSIGIPATLQGLFHLFERRIFSVSHANDETAREKFLEKARARGINIGPD